MTTPQRVSEQALTPDSLVSIMLGSANGWDQVAAFVTLTMHHKMELAREWQRRLIGATIQYQCQTLPYSRVCY